MSAALSSPIVSSFAKLGPVDVDDVADLRHYLSWVPDPRAKRGRWYSLVNLLAVRAAAVLAGATTIEAVAEWVADAPAQVLKTLGVRLHPLRWRRSPSRRCLVAVLSRIEGDALDQAVCAWLADRAALARTRTETCTDLAAVAVDGKTLRGSKDADGHRVHLLSAIDHAQSPTLAQRDVGAKTNETGEFCQLLAWLDREGKVVTFDALHTVKAQARWLVETKRAHYVAIVKANQCATRRSVTSPLQVGQTRREVCWV